MCCLVLGLDIGTQSVKALIYDATARCVTNQTQSALSLHSLPDGTREQHPSMWISAIESCLSQIPSSTVSRIQAICVSGQQHGLVALDSSGDVLCPAKLWCDTTSHAECLELISTVGEARCLQLVGKLTSSYTAPKLLWMKKHRPSVYARISTIFQPKDYINFWLTGERTTECGDASGTGLFDVERRCWSETMLGAIDNRRDLRMCMGRLVGHTEWVGCVREEVRQKLGLGHGTMVGSGGGDNMMAAIGTGNVRPGIVTVSMGTSGTVFAYSEQIIKDEKGVLAMFCDSTDAWLPLMCTMNCTGVTEKWRGMFGLDVEDMEREVEMVEVGSEGLITVPFFQGERTPDLPAARGLMVGLGAGNERRGVVIRSAMEAVVMGMKQGVQRLRELGVNVDEVVMTGGGARSATWRQIMADVCQVRVRKGAGEEAAFGAALMAVARIEDKGIRQVCDEHVKKGDVCVPIEENVKKYRDVYKTYLRMVEIVKDLYF